MSVRTALIPAALTLALLQACSGATPVPDGGTGGGGGGGGLGAGGGVGGGAGGGSEDAGLSASNFCARYANALCTKNTQCGPMRIENINDCFNEQVRSCELSYGQPLRSGALSLDLALATRCLDGISQADCDLLPLTIDAYCNSYISPAAPIGGTCTSSYCQDGYCRLDGGQASCGTCEPYLPVGAACTTVGQCEPDAGNCVASGLGGATCVAWLNDGQACTSANRCRSRLCYGRADGGAWCGPLKTGEACGSSTQCGASGYCKPGPAGGGSVCAPRIALGSTCTDLAADDGCQGGADATCLDGVCKVVTFGTRTEGQSCDEASQCAANLYCSNLRTSTVRNGICARKLTADAGCVNAYPQECQLGLVCVGQRCIEYRDPGESCISSTQCVPYTRCLAIPSRGNECVEYARPGEQCPSSALCHGGYCERLPDAGYGQCIALYQDGQACTNASECYSSRCYVSASTTNPRQCFPGCF